jgi:multimeric flavodoxin WrbA
MSNLEVMNHFKTQHILLMKAVIECHGIVISTPTSDSNVTKFKS